MGGAENLELALHDDPVVGAVKRGDDEAEQEREDQEHPEVDRARGPGSKISIQAHHHRVLELVVVLEKEDKGDTDYQDPKPRFDRSHLNYLLL